MADIIQEAPDVQPQTPVEPPSPPPSEEPSLSEHIQQFHEGGDDETETPQPKKRHRSFKNQARPEDVPRIKELTGKIRELEEKLATVQPKPEPKPEPYTPPIAPNPSKFEDKEPELTDEKYASASDPYSAWQRDLARWDRKKEAFEASQQQATQQTEAQTKAFAAQIEHRAQTYAQKRDAYLTQHPDRRPVFEKMPNVENPLLVESVWAVEDGPDVVYHLLTQPGLMHELHLLTSGKPVSGFNVAATTEWLRSRLQAGPTGAAVRESPPPAPRPPTPVRTRPMPPPEGPPGDNSSLEEHARYFKTATRR